MEKILPISLKLNFTPNTLGSYGLIIKNDVLMPENVLKTVYK